MSSGKYITKDGYVMVYVGKAISSNGYIPEHVLVMEKKIGRKLLPGEIVHHIEIKMVDGMEQECILQKQKH